MNQAELHMTQSSTQGYMRLKQGVIALYMILKDGTWMSFQVFKGKFGRERNTHFVDTYTGDYFMKEVKTDPKIELNDIIKSDSGSTSPGQLSGNISLQSLKRSLYSV